MERRRHLPEAVAHLQKKRKDQSIRHIRPLLQEIEQRRDEAHLQTVKNRANENVEKIEKFAVIDRQDLQISLEALLVCVILFSIEPDEIFEPLMYVSGSLAILAFWKLTTWNRSRDVEVVKEAENIFKVMSENGHTVPLNPKSSDTKRNLKIVHQKLRDEI